MRGVSFIAGFSVYAATPLEHGDIEPAQASRISNSLDARNLRVLDGKHQGSYQRAPRHEDQSARAVDERRLHAESQTSRERDHLSHPHRGAFHFARLADFLGRRVDADDAIDRKSTR